MQTKQIVSWLREQAIRMPEEVHKRGMIRAADKLVELEAALKDEMYRHDRLQDFEVAEAQELTRLKVENVSMAAELKKIGGCGVCKSGKVCYTEEPCFSCMQDPNYPCWEWKGMNDNA